VRPLLYEIQLTSNGIDEFYQTARNWPPGYGGISAIGVHLGDAELQGILTKIRDANPALTHDQIAEFLTATIRKNVHPGVGANTSAIIIPLPGSAAVRSKFFPIEPHPVLLRTPSEDRSVNVH
jgi:hypothetical protein